MSADYEGRRGGPGASYVNTDLASAVRDVVQISRNGSTQPVPTSQLAGQGYSRSAGARPTENPFETAESNNHESGGTVEPSRQRFKGSMSAGADGRTNYSGTGDDIDPNETREQREARRRAIAGQRKDPTQKKAGRHADVIDKWDPTGLGTAVWHHSGPYDAAAPSRNVNQPTTRAPMQAFGPGGSPPRLTPPAVPAKDENLRRGSAPRPVSSGRRTSGGLSGTYSTSVPTSGGYFPDLQEVEDDGSRTNRLRQRDEKERALKAAWGIDTPEPFEDFGTSPRDEAITLNDDNYSSFARNQQAATSPGPRSPGLRNPFGGRSRSPPMEEMITAPVVDEERPRTNSISRPGVKRTKSLMQRLKSMVRQKSVDEGMPPSPNSPRSLSMSAAPDFVRRPSEMSPGAWKNQPVLEEDEVDGYETARDANGQETGYSAGSIQASPVAPTPPHAAASVGRAI